MPQTLYVKQAVFSEIYHYYSFLNMLSEKFDSRQDISRIIYSSKMDFWLTITFFLPSFNLMLKILTLLTFIPKWSVLAD